MRSNAARALLLGHRSVSPREDPSALQTHQRAREENHWRDAFPLLVFLLQVSGPLPSFRLHEAKDKVVDDRCTGFDRLLVHLAQDRPEGRAQTATPAPNNQRSSSSFFARCLAASPRNRPQNAHHYLRPVILQVQREQSSRVFLRSWRCC